MIAGRLPDSDVGPGLSLGHRVSKRTLDVVSSAVGLLLTGWIIGIAYLLAAWDTGEDGLIRQTRVGMNGRFFRLLKLRTMRPVAGLETTVTTADDPRITRIGRVLRRSKIDELPQLYNVLVGDMSLVGPRPDVPGLADRLEGADRIILSVRPGITGPATLKYRDEEHILAAQDDPEAYNRNVIFPDKVRINRQYVEHYRFWRDILYVVQTLVPVLKGTR